VKRGELAARAISLLLPLPGSRPGVVKCDGRNRCVCVYDTLGLAPSWSFVTYALVVCCMLLCCVVWCGVVCTYPFLLSLCRLSFHPPNPSRLLSKKECKPDSSSTMPRGKGKGIKHRKPSRQILATLPLPSGTRAWQTISFRLVPHSSHSASSALSRQRLPFDEGPTPAALS
jgi:hypothetical protein